MEQPQPLGRNNVKMPPTNDDSAQGHPAYQELLSQIPEEFHNMIIPKLTEWDKKQQDQVQALHTQYDPYKDLIEQGIDPADIEKAAYLLEQFQTNPDAVVKQAIEAFELPYQLADSNSGNNQNQPPAANNDSEWEYGDDLANHPLVKQLTTQLETVQNQLKTREEREQEEASASEFQQELTKLQEQYKDQGEFDNLYVTALVAQADMEPEEAVKAYYQMKADILAGAQQQNQQQQNQPPVVMGGDGNSGSGLPAEPVKIGELTKGGVSDLVIQMLKNGDIDQTG